MALSDKQLLIVPNVGQTADPKIVFSGADASTAAQNITLQVYPTNGGTLSFEGSVGQLFSIANTMTGTIFSANDVSGIPSIEVLDTGMIKLGQYGGNTVLGSGTDAGKKLQVYVTTNTDGIAIKGGTGATNTSLILNNAGTSGNSWDISSTAGGHGSGDGKLLIGVGFSPKVAIDGIGNVGIGTTAPSSKLDVRRSDNTDGDAIAFGSLSYVMGRLGEDASTNAVSLSNVYDNAYSSIQFRLRGSTAAKTVMSINGNGNTYLTGNFTLTGIDAVVNADWLSVANAGSLTNYWGSKHAGTGGSCATVLYAANPGVASAEFGILNSAQTCWVMRTASTGAITFGSTTASSSSTTGALLVAGGLGVAGRISAGTGSGSANGFGFDSDTGMTSTGDGNLKFYSNNVYCGGPSVGVNLWDINVTGSAGSATDATHFNNTSLYTSKTNLNTLNSGYSAASDGSDIWINYRGYNDAQAYYRDFRVGNGKGTQIALFTGSTGALAITGAITSGGTAVSLSGHTHAYLSSEGAITVNGNLTVGNTTASYIYMVDTDNTTRSIHCNSDQIGFLNSSNGWGAYCTNSGDWYAHNFSGNSSGTNTGDQTLPTLSSLGGQAQLNGTGFVKASGTTVSYDNTSYAALSGASFTGTITTKAPPLVTAITSATAGAIEIPNVSVGTVAGFVTALHQQTTYTSGYIQHLSLGNYRTASQWGGGFFVGLGGADAGPTEYYLMGFGGTISHSSGTVNISGNAATATSAATSGYASYVNASFGRTDPTAYPVCWIADSGNKSIAYACAAVTIQSSTGTLNATTVNATNFCDSTGGYNVNLGSNGGEGRGLVAGFSGGSYGGIGYNVRHTTTGGSWICPSADSSTYLLFNDGFTFLRMAGGTAGRAASYSQIGRLDNSGNLTVTGDITAYSSSDKNLKTNIEVIPNAINKVKALSGITFDWNDTFIEDNPGREIRREAGVIAQEVQEVLPEIVTTRDNGYLAIKYEKLTPLLIEAIKEQQGQIELLQQQVKSLLALVGNKNDA